MRFLLTKELGRLVKWLRILGFDAEYFSDNSRSSLIINALRDDRTILTRNHHLPKGKGVKIAFIKNEKIKEQVAEVLEKFQVEPDSGAMFTRCILCNELLTKIEKEKIKDRVPEYVFNTQEEFVVCPKCSRAYWKGTHWGNVEELITQIKAQINADKNP